MGTSTSRGTPYSGRDIGSFEEIIESGKKLRLQDNDENSDEQKRHSNSYQHVVTSFDLTISATSRFNIISKLFSTEYHIELGYYDVQYSGDSNPKFSHYFIEVDQGKNVCVKSLPVEHAANIITELSECTLDKDLVQYAVNEVYKLGNKKP
jgi:hypothetical protein